ncbi:MAG TPA: NADPH:quinone oxidoreductase family protein [Hyphomicrobiaceae bacterium]|nr:NADPH:quinone oxidoreductase family protein [Hyphomicrobiaceae bacterium]
MRAVIVREFGPIANAALEEVPEPVAGTGEALVEIHAAPVNFADLLTIAGKYQVRPKLPFTPGRSPAGIVRAVGAGVKDLQAGDRVLAMAWQGGFAELVAVDAALCYRLPDALSLAHAAAMSLTYDTAWVALRDRARIAAGETVLVLGASGGVGSAAVQLAKAMGAKVLAGVSSADKFAALSAAGADGMVDVSRADLRETLREQVWAQTDGRGADVILDALGGDVFDAAIRALAWRGRLVVMGFAAGRIPTVAANYLLVKNIEVSGIQISDYHKRRPDIVRRCYGEIHDWLADGSVKPPATTTLPLEDFATALQLIADRKAQGRLVLSPRDREQAR